MSQQPKKRRLILTSTRTCPDDGTALVADATSSYDLLSAGVTGQALRRCPTCGSKFTSSTLTDAIASMTPKIDPLSVLPKWAFSPGSTSLPPLDDAKREKDDIAKQLDALRTQLDRLQNEKPDQRSDEDVARLREGLSGVVERVAALGRSLDDAKNTLLGLLPAPEDLATLKLVRAELTELRRIVDQHVDDDQKRRGSEQERADSARNRKVAIYVAVATIIGGLIGAVLGAVLPKVLGFV